MSRLLAVLVSALCISAGAKCAPVHIGLCESVVHAQKSSS